MCGIAGIVGPSKDRRETLRSMVSAIAHRGPDGQGTYDDGVAALGHRRLAVIDLSDNAAQPMANEDDSIQLVYNGEIYNFAELREDLVRKGHRFISRSDTEVLVHLYEERGDRFVEALNGMFAFALWDQKRGRLLLGRDRFGQKPLFYAMAGEALVFASEIKAILRHPAVPRTPSRRAIDSLLTVNFVPAPHTFYEHIHRLKPGHLLVLEPGRPPVTRSFAPPPPERDLRISFEDAVAEVERLFTASVKRQLVADVPVGVFASGGIDSTLILERLRHLGRPRVEAFSLGFHEASHSEVPFAQKATSLLGTRFRALMFEASELRSPELVLDLFDEPFADIAALPTFALAKAARPHITVALTGDGGDEIFGGYEHQVVAFWLDRMRLARGPRAALARKLAALVPVDVGFRGRLRTLRRGLEALGCHGLRESTRMLRSNLTEADRAALYTPDFRRELGAFDPWDALFPEPRADLPLARLFGIGDRAFSDQFLLKSDFASMAVGLETRSPFLDVPLVDFAARLPVHHLVQGAKGKPILRALVTRHVDAGLGARRKMGFAPPVDDWLRADLAPLVQDTLLAPGALVADLVEPARTARLFEEHRTRKANHRRVLWALLLTELWLRRERRALAAPEHRAARPSAPAITLASDPAQTAPSSARRTAS
ncbi:MAG: asparagine synthase (glutamine-hydrolyzing) [Polyangiaceae bacterium]